MKTKVISPVKVTTEDFEKIEEAIKELFRKEIYLPLIHAIGSERDVLTNSTDDLVRSIQSGRIRFYRGEFTGRFDAAVSRELKKIGAKWDKRQGSFRIPLGELSLEIKNAIDLAQSKLDRTFQKLNAQIDKILPENISDNLKIEKFFDSTLWKVDKALNKTLEGITVAPKLTKEQREKIAEDYTNNMKLFIKDWSEKEIVELRKRVQASTLKGYRYENMVKMIQQSYEVSLNKAKFLARQETSLMVTEFKQNRYKDAGVQEYIWGCVAASPKHPVRPMHKKNEGKVFTWDNPPVVDDKGNRKNPGQDYNCRCFARPVVKF